MKMLKALIYVVASAATLLLVFVVALWTWGKLEYHLPSDQSALEKFASHKADFVRFAELLRKDPSATYIDSNGAVGFDGSPSRLVPEYKELAKTVGAKYVLVGKDGSIEFALWGSGCAICSDSYKGVRYDPNPRNSARMSPWGKTVVSSLEGDALPHEDGKISSGLYVVPIEPQWFIYRLEIQE